jgi:hypothetical protein
MFALGALSCVGLAAAQSYDLFMAETPGGFLAGNTSAYGGLQRFQVTASAATQIGTLPNTSLSDPVGVVVSGGNLYVSNRHGNNQGVGTIQRFGIGPANLSGGSAVVTAPFSGFHGFNFAPNGDLFVTTVSTGSRRFRPDGLGGYTDIGGVASGQVRDVWISPDGNTMIETGSGGMVFRSVGANSLGAGTAFNIDNSFFHQMAFRGNALYTAANANGNIYRVDLNASFQPISATLIGNVAGALGITFSPDGSEMWVGSTGSSNNSLNRFALSGNSWVLQQSVSVGSVSPGYLAAVPEPFTMVGMGLAALIAARRKRKS